MPWVFRSIRDFCHMLVITPGPTEPACLDPYVEELFQDFKRYGPLGMPDHIRVSMHLLALELNWEI